MGDLKEHHDLIETLDRAYAPDRLPTPDRSAFLSAVQTKMMTRVVLAVAAVAAAALLVLVAVVVAQIKSGHPAIGPQPQQVEPDTIP